MTTIYDNVKKIADEKGISIAEVERSAGVANGTIGKWRTGKATVDTVAKVAKVLGTDFSELIPLSQGR